MSEYTEKADNFLKSHNLEFRAVLVGDDCPRFCEDALADRDMDKVNTFPRKTHIHGKHYRCTISGQGRGHVSFDFWNSYADEEFYALGTAAYRNRRAFQQFRSPSKSEIEQHYFTDERGVLRLRRGPQAYDLLACIQKYDVGSFEDFCADFGYDTDSRRAGETYHAVQAEVKKVRKFFTPAELEELQEIS